MQMFTARVLAIHAEEWGDFSLTLSDIAGRMPSPGRYLSGAARKERHNPLPVSLFSGGSHAHTLVAVTQDLQPHIWPPGTELMLHGPLGSGFESPSAGQRLALASVDLPPTRLLPLALYALEQNCSVSLFTDRPPKEIPPDIEIQPLAALHDALRWADQLALDLPAWQLPHLRNILQTTPDGYLPPVSQALVLIPMPCSGFGECGACAVLSYRGGHSLACKQGPVFSLSDLAW
jgi:NAD(P)H-flavin reductase